MEVGTEIEIGATSQRVWQILMDVERYPDWNPFIRKLDGILAAGEPIRFRVALPLGLRWPMRARVLAVVPYRELRWAGSLLSPWLFHAEHYHVLEPGSSSSLRLRHGEIFSGVLEPLLRPILRWWAFPTYRAFNRALQQRAERQPAVNPELQR